MKSTFNSVVKIAVEEIIKKHASESRYGYFLSKEDLEKLTEEITNFLQASRTLKEKGDEMLASANLE